MKKKLILIAPGISKNDVGEVYVAYCWLEHLVEFFDVTLITLHRKNKPTISKDELPIQLVEFHEKGFLSRYERFNSMLKPWYTSFYKDARKWIKNQAKAQHFDWIHQITPMASRYPPIGYGLGIPYSIGPVAGGLDTPPGFEKEMASMPWYTKLRKLDSIRAKSNSQLRNGYQQANMIFAAAPYVKERLIKLYNIQGTSGPKFYIENELGITDINKSEKTFTPPYKLLFVGRIVRSKGVRDIVRAVPYLKELPFTLDIVGDGNDLDACKQEATELGVNSFITFHGKKTKQEVAEFYREAHLIIFPSFREPTGGVVVEAMSFGVPQIVCDYGGPASILQPSNLGYIVKLTVPDAYPIDIANQIKLALSKPEELNTKSNESLHWAENNYIWKNKIKKIAGIISEEIEAKLQ